MILTVSWIFSVLFAILGITNVAAAIIKDLPMMGEEQNKHKMVISGIVYIILSYYIFIRIAM
jgi:hypothetical protein